MAYQALYRKWRPDEFEEVKGQEHIVKTLRNQIAADRIGHAYLFCGTRGTGKTTIAKLFAKTVNCEHPVDGSPCNECSSCKAIRTQTSMNVIEIDAASNNGVDSIREIRENVQYPPTEGKYKVYIIDEVHMLSIGAFNALLKTLEEPPSYVIFILATTESHKIPVTILSRCQRYDFKRISIDTIANRLTELMKREEIEVEEKAIRYVAKAADGSMRDALSLLDQCIAFHLGEVLTYENVLEVLGAVDTDVLSVLFQSIVNKDVSAMLHHIESLVMDGREMIKLVNDFVWYLRNLLLLKEASDMTAVLEVSETQRPVLEADAQCLDADTLMRYIRICSELANQLRYSSQKRIDVEVAFVKLCKPQMESDITSLKQRVEELEKELAELKEHGVRMVEETVSFSAQQAVDEKLDDSSLIKDIKEHYSKAELKDLELIKQSRQQIIEAIKQQIGSLAARAYSVARTTIGSGDNFFNIGFLESNISMMSRLNSEETIDKLKLIFAEICGKDVSFRVYQIPKGQENDNIHQDMNLITIPVEQK